MSDTKENRNSIPVSVLIADSRNKLNEIVNHPLLPSSIVELILKEAWQTSAIKAQKQLVSDYEKYREQTAEDTENSSKEDNNGL